MLHSSAHTQPAAINCDTVQQPHDHHCTPPHAQCRGLFGVCVRPRAGSSSSASALPRRHGSAGIGDGSIGSQDQSDEEDDDEAVRRQVRMVSAYSTGLHASACVAHRQSVAVCMP